MTQTFIIVAIAALAIGGALWLIVRLSKQSAKAQIETQLAQKGEANARAIAEVVTNDNPDAVRQRLRDDKF